MIDVSGSAPSKAFRNDPVFEWSAPPAVVQRSEYAAVILQIVAQVTDEASGFPRSRGRRGVQGLVTLLTLGWPRMCLIPPVPRHVTDTTRARNIEIATTPLVDQRC